MGKGEEASGAESEGIGMKTPQLFPKPRKRMRQPRKDVMRDELRRAADRIIELRAENERLRRPWWRRIFRRDAA